MRIRTTADVRIRKYANTRECEGAIMRACDYLHFYEGTTMGHILTFAMQKGGVGKTTTTLSVGVGLAQRGARVLLVDLDPQANLTQGLGIDPYALDYSIYEVLLNPQAGTEFATIRTDACIDLLPSTLALAGAELELAGKVGRELLLRKALRTTANGAKDSSASVARYDYILIDPPPSLGVFTLNALAASDAVIVPLQVHAYAFKAMPQLEATIELVRELNPKLEIGGIVCTLSDRRTILSQVVEAQIRAQYADLVFHSVIPVNTKVAEAPAAGQPISLYAPASNGAVAYMQLCEELEQRYGWR